MKMERKKLFLSLWLAVLAVFLVELAEQSDVLGKYRRVFRRSHSDAQGALLSMALLPVRALARRTAVGRALALLAKTHGGRPSAVRAHLRHRARVLFLVEGSVASCFLLRYARFFSLTHTAPHGTVGRRHRRRAKYAFRLRWRWGPCRTFRVDGRRGHPALA